MDNNHNLDHSLGFGNYHFFHARRTDSRSAGHRAHLDCRAPAPGTQRLINQSVAKIVPDLKLGQFVVDFSTLVALIVYVFIGYLILQAFSYVGPRYYNRDDGGYRD